mgnify:CR=1 FL=1
MLGSGLGTSGLVVSFIYWVFGTSTVRGYLLTMNLGKGFYSYANFRSAPAVCTDASKQATFAGGGWVSACGAYDWWVYGTAAARKMIDYLEGDTVVEAVRDFGLTASDFAATDPTSEMLYLLEAKSAAMAESRRLNRRLDGARYVVRCVSMSHLALFGSLLPTPRAVGWREPYAEGWRDP